MIHFISVRRTQRRFLLAAHNEVHKEGTDLIAIHNKQKLLETEALQGVSQFTTESGVEQDKQPEMASE